MFRYWIGRDVTLFWLMKALVATDFLTDREQPMLNARVAVRAATRGSDDVRTPAQPESVADSLARIADLLRLVRSQFLEIRTLHPSEHRAADREATLERR